MALGLFVVPYKRRNPGVVPPERYCSVDDSTAAIRADGGDWDETESRSCVSLAQARFFISTLTGTSDLSA